MTEDSLVGDNYQQLRRELYACPGLGYAKISLSSPSGLGLEMAKAKAFLIISAIAQPIEVYRSHGLWKKIGVRFDVAPEKVEGVGFIPLHIDCVNATNPPDIVGFYCHKADPKGGGESLVSSFANALCRLTSEEINSLKTVQIREGKFFELSNIGDELNPFPLIEQSSTGLEWVRYTGKARSAIVGTSPSAVKRFEQLLLSAAVTINLEAGDLLIVNQRLAAHGRLPLGDVGNSPSSARELWQIFGRVSSEADAYRIQV